MMMTGVGSVCVATKMKLAALHGALLVVALTIHLADADAEVFLKSNSITWTKDFVVANAGRERREAKSSMTADEIREVIDHHNALRAAEGAANMELMVRD